MDLDGESPLVLAGAVVVVAAAVGLAFGEPIRGLVAGLFLGGATFTFRRMGQL